MVMGEMIELEAGTFVMVETKFKVGDDVPTLYPRKRRVILSTGW